MNACCPICDQPVPPGARWPGGTCGDPACRKAFAEWATSRRVVVRRVRYERLTGQRTCNDCGRTFPLDADHFKPVRGGFYRRRCNECQRNAERIHSRNAYYRLKNDPERYAAYLADARLRHRMRREQRTGSVPPRKFHSAVGAWRHDTGKHGLALEPIQAWLEEVLERECPDANSGGRDTDRMGQDIQAFAASLGVDTRAIWRIQHGEHHTVSLAVADRLLTNYGRPVVIRTRDLEARLMAWAQELPGNGTRLLHYLDRAEHVAHLPDVSLLRVEDLYPELDDA